MRSSFAFGVIFLFLTIQAAAAPIVPFEPGTAIIRLAPGAKKLNVQQQLSAIGPFTISEAIVSDLGIYKVKVNAGSDLDTSIQRIKSLAAIKYVQKNHRVELRSAPNDAEFSKQWGLKNSAGGDIRASGAWAHGTGGKDAKGNDIVVAIVDGGLDARHKDLVNNIWVNPKEIAGNQIDDDGNGYVDDVNGWDALRNVGDFVGSAHGTHVAGIVGASGNNGLQTTGVNWSVKIMNVTGASGDTATVQKAYGYVLKLKKQWLESGGKAGANVVATNSSFGVDKAKCNEGSYPIWNDMYNEMGKVGILSAAATANGNWNVDDTGDVPTGCNSQFLITVTNTQRNDTKATNAGFGKTSIHLGAPGSDIYSLLPTDRAGSMSGTSMATPHVAGAVALMHSLANAKLNSLYLENPERGALAIRNAILRGVDPLDSLRDLTSTGGRLNVQKSAGYVKSFQE